jgi:hypothetical protein
MEVTLRDASRVAVVGGVEPPAAFDEHVCVHRGEAEIAVNVLHLHLLPGLLRLDKILARVRHRQFRGVTQTQVLHHDAAAVLRCKRARNQTIEVRCVAAVQRLQHRAHLHVVLQKRRENQQRE